MKLTKDLLNVAYEFYKEGNSVKDTKEFLEKEYNIYICPETLRKSFRRFGLVRRKNKESITISRRKHIDVEKVLSDYKEVKSIRALARNHKISRGTVRKILVENDMRILDNDEAILISNLKHKKIPFYGDSQDKTYLYGFVLGDVHVFKRSKFTLRAITHTTHRSFVDLFIKEFSKFGKVNSKYRAKKKEWGLFIDLDYKSFSFLEERKKEGLPNWINKNNFVSFLSGFIDADGSVIIRKAGDYFQYVIRVFGQDKKLLNQIKSILEEMGYHPSFYKNFGVGESRNWNGRIIKYNKDYYAMDIYKKEETIKLLSILKLKHEEKIKRKNLALFLYSKGLVKWDDVKKPIRKLRELIQSQILAQ
ncbi:hypothetical protein CMO93_02065 [Candidatus Woesearchaeota archaeon]|nr:hypothetical protein [Candidatus Woesearchaeota archaeon]|tara:strand:+ start:1181 stop:2266 length:1086 start_codon:yes stop_codon:yes gene_type:complete